MEYRCETNGHVQGTGDAYAIQFKDNAHFFDGRGGNTDGVAITDVDQGGNTLTHYVIAVKDFLAIARLLGGVENGQIQHHKTI